MGLGELLFRIPGVSVFVIRPGHPRDMDDCASYNLAIFVS